MEWKAPLWSACLVAVSVSLVVGCSEKERAPVENGGFLVFQINEPRPSGVDQFELRFRFIVEKDRYLRVKIDSPSSARSNGFEGAVAMDLAGVPKDGPFAFQTAGADTLVLRALYLPTKFREPGAQSPAGLVKGKTRFEKWNVWEVEYEAPGATGAMFYDEQLGMLVGWRIDYNGKLIDARVVQAS